MKKYLVLIAFLIFAQTANASKLPDDVWKYVKNNLPDAQQRFDSVITLKNGIMYIPLYPPVQDQVSSISAAYTYPASKSLKQLPEVVLLNNGFSLLKVSKDKNGNYTLTQKDDLPIKVRLGLMPQDMLIPVGLKIPESLKLTLGDLLIPSKEATTLPGADKEKDASMAKKNDFIQTAEFKNKKIFINAQNSKFLQVYNSGSSAPSYELKLSSMPLKIVTSNTSKVALVLYWSGKQLDIINLEDENTLAKIDIDANATDVALNKKSNLAYVSSQNANSIYVINLSSMELEKVIKLDQKPSKISYSELDDTISFYDIFTSQVYTLIQNANDYMVQPIGEIKNVSKILSDTANIYAISRTDGKLYVFDKVQAKLISSIDIDKKPTDALIYDYKIYILCSKDNYMDVYDIAQNKIVSREQLSTDGFYSQMNNIANSKNIIITGLNTKNYLIYNLETMKLVRKQESYVDVANIVVIDKNQAL